MKRVGKRWIQGFLDGEIGLRESKAEKERKQEKENPSKCMSEQHRAQRKGEVSYQIKNKEIKFG